MKYISPRTERAIRYRKLGTKLRNLPAAPLAEEDLSLFVLEALSKVCESNPRTLSHAELRPDNVSGLTPSGSKTAFSQLLNNIK